MEFAGAALMRLAEHISAGLAECTAHEISIRYKQAGTRTQRGESTSIFWYLAGAAGILLDIERK